MPVTPPPHDFGDAFLTQPRPAAPPTGKKGKGGGLGSNLQGMLLLIFVPWLLFVAVQTPFFLIYHHHPLVVGFIVFSGFAISTCFMIINVGRKAGGMWYMFMGLLSIFACLAASVAGFYNYHQNMFNYYSYETLREYTNVLPSEPASGRVDAGKLVFSFDARVDVTRSVGYKASEWYCVAPVLDETSGTRVEYWAAGVDCCTARGDFGCDSAWDWKAKAGVVILRSADYLPSQLDYFHKAIKEAEAAYGFVSSDDALLIRWVSDPIFIQDSFYSAGFGFLVGTAVIYFFVSVMLGALLQVLSKRK